MGIMCIFLAQAYWYYKKLIFYGCWIWKLPSTIQKISFIPMHKLLKLLNSNRAKLIWNCTHSSSCIWSRRLLTHRNQNLADFNEDGWRGREREREKDDDHDRRTVSASHPHCDCRSNKFWYFDIFDSILCFFDRFLYCARLRFSIMPQ